MDEKNENNGNEIKEPEQPSERNSGNTDEQNQDEKLSSTDNYNSGFTLNSILSGFFARTEIVRYVFAFLSIVSLHAICFSLQVDSAISNIIDVVFVANVAFRFSMLFVVLLFVVKFGPVVLEIFLGAIIKAPIRVWMSIRKTRIIFSNQYDYYLEPEHLHKQLVLIEKIDEVIDSAEPVQHYTYQFILVFFATWLIYLDFTSIFSAVLLSATASIICKVSVLSRFNKVSFVRRSDYHSVWYGRETPGKIPFSYLYSKNKNTWSLLFGLYTFVSIFSASTGILRYSYLLNLPPLRIEMSNNEVVIGNYIGSTADGIIIRNCSGDKVNFIAYNGLVHIDNLSETKQKNSTCIKHAFSLLSS